MAMMLTLAICTIVFFLLAHIARYVVQKIRIILKVLKLPGPPTKNLFVGNCDEFFGSGDEILKTQMKHNKQYYPIYCLYLGPTTAVNILAPEDFELILSNNQHNGKSWIYDNLYNWLKEGLLTSSGKKWQTRRHILTPAFHFSILQQFVSIFNEETESLLDVLKSNTGRPINIVKYISLFTLKTMAESSMGTTLDSTESGGKYREAIEEIGAVLLYKLMRPWSVYRPILFLADFKTYTKEKRIINVLHNFTGQVIKEREKQFVTNNANLKKKRMAMLDLLLKSKQNDKLIDDQGIQEEVDTFMFEGHDTSASALSFCLMLIANHKNVQDRLLEELNQVVSDRTPTFNDLQNLTYMEMTLKESLRLYPSVFFISRILGEDVKTHSGYHLLKGTMTHLHIYGLHHDARIYPDPEKFDPERFLPENVLNRHHFAYLPFSAGARNCIGQKFALLEMKAALCGILRKFILEPVDTQQTVILMADVILRAKDGVKVKLLPRQ